jgi:predicted transcriptional regulator of viral defense system
MRLHIDIESAAQKYQLVALKLIVKCKKMYYNVVKCRKSTFYENFTQDYPLTSKVAQYIDSLTAAGEISFTLNAVQKALGVSQNAALSAIKRLKKHNKVVSPSKGYYLILTPEFRNLGCLPADFFIDDLMHHLGMTYYVCLLSAAMFYGAAHQQPQMMQVMIEKTKKNIQCGQVSLLFIKNNSSNNTPLNKIKTRTGYMNVSTPEATARDMMKYMTQCGGIGRVMTVIEELAENMDNAALEKLACEEKGRIWLRRLGYLLDLANAEQLSSSLYNHFDKKSEFIPLVPYVSMTGAPRNKKWRIAVNAAVESDLDDT